MGKVPLVLSDPLKVGCEFTSEDDFTVFVGATGFRKALRDATHAEDDSEEALAIESEQSFDFQAEYDLRGVLCTGRLHAALCFSRKAFSVTLRSLKASKPPVKLASKHSRVPLLPSKGTIRPYEILYNAVFSSESGMPSGLVLLAGGTGSGKTFALNQLVTLYLHGELEKSPKRAPHVLVLGDPIETKCFATEDELLDRARARQIGYQRRSRCRPLDFTARTLGPDVASVKAALRDALRETPSVVVISELREDRDFKAVLDFAATGHLVFATSHNTSLVDAMGKLSRLFGADSASMRADLVQRLKAVIHIQRLTVDNQSERLPALWRSTSTGRRNFISEGLSSILPKAPSGHDDGAHGVLGRYWMAMQLGLKPYYREALRLDLNGR
jgi:hypothetical protein